MDRLHTGLHGSGADPVDVPRPCHIIECNGDSYRLKDAKQRRRRPPPDESTGEAVKA